MVGFEVDQGLCCKLRQKYCRCWPSTWSGVGAAWQMWHSLHGPLQCRTGDSQGRVNGALSFASALCIEQNVDVSVWARRRRVAGMYMIEPQSINW
jgi:hypothetical protein